MKFLRLLLCIPALVCVAFMRAVWPWWKIRVTHLPSSRIGHLAGNMAVYLAERAAGKHAGYTDLWTHHGEVSNAYFGRMLGRVLRIDRTRFALLVILCNKLFQGWQRHIYIGEDIDRDPDGFMRLSPAPLAFTEAEEARGQAQLRAWGLPPGAKFVCLIVRDGAYLGEGGEYHDFRDSDIDTYAQAVHELTQRGYYVFRMGARVAKPMEIPDVREYDRRVFDYATSGMRSDFMDVYLGAHCEFCISNGTGFDAIPVLFRRPVCYVNYAPIEYLFTFLPRSLAIFKHYEKDGRRMTLEEIYATESSMALHAAQYQAEGIKLVDNTAQEIANVVREMEMRVSGSAAHRDWYPLAQAAFWQQFPRSLSPYTQRPLHGEIRMRIGAEFLKQYTCTCGEHIYTPCAVHGELVTV